MRFVALLLIAAPLSAQVALDETCVVSTLNRTTRVLADGSWVLPNVPTNFGSIRVRANCVDGGAVRAGQSGFVRLAPGGALHVSDIVFDAPRPIPARLTLRASRALLTAAGETAQLEAIAIMPDGALADVTPASSGTDYRTSNPAIASVSGDGLVTAIASGTVLLSATHEGTLGAVELSIVAAADSDGDGLPDDFEIENGLDPSNGADSQRDPDGDGLSIGDEFRRGLDPFDADTDGDGLDDGREVLVVGTDGLRFDTDGDGLSDGLELELGTDPRDGASFDYAAALVSLEVRPAAFAIVFDAVLGDASAQLQVVGALRDGSSIDLTAPSRGTSYLSSDLTVCALGVDPGRVFAGQPGDCTIAVSNSGRTATARGIVQTFAPRLLASVPIPGSANAIDVAGDHAFIAAGSAGLQIADVGNRRVPGVVGSIATAGIAHDVAVAGATALVAAGAAGLEVLDVAAPASPLRLATLAFPGVARGVAAADELAVVVTDATSTAGMLFVVDTANRAAPSVLGSTTTVGLPRAVAVDTVAAIAAVAEGPLGVEVFDLADPALPAARGRVATGDARAVALDGGYALVADVASSLSVIDVRDPGEPRVVATVARELGGVPVDVARFDDLAFTADVGFFAEAAVPIFDLADPAAPLARTRLSLPTADPGRGVDADGTYVYLLACAGCDGKGAGSSHLDIGQYRSLRDQLGVAPQVALTSPGDGDVVAAGSRLEITADASDDVGVLAVEFLVDGAVANRDERPAFGTTIIVPDDASRLTLGARAYDFAANNAFAQEIEVAVARTGTTTLTGVVVGPREEAVAGARVVVSAGGPNIAGTATTGDDGAFRIADLMVGLEPIMVQASAVIGDRKHRGSSPPVAPTVGGETSVGAIQLEPTGVMYPGPRTVTGSPAAALAHGFFDLDDVEDVAVVHSLPTQGVAILIGQGDGRFTLRQRVSGVGGFWLASGDLTVDGVDDLVVGTGGRAIVLRGAGDGTFTITEDLALSTAAESPRIGDFDADGLPDVLFGARQNRNLALLPGNGDGSLRAPTLFALQGSPEDLAIGDFDLDGRLDVAAALTMNSAPHAVAILLGDGTGGLTASASLSFSLPPLRVAAGDFDDNGRLDLAIGAGRDSAARAFIALGNGDATFTTPPALAVTLQGTPITMAVDDLDGNGRLDLAIGRDRQPCDDILLLRGDGTGSFPSADRRAWSDSCGALPRLVVSEQTGDDLLEVLALDDTGLTSYLASDGFAFGNRFEIATLAEQIVTPDLDRDGVPDLVYGRRSTPGLSIQLGNGDGTFRSLSSVATGVYAFQLGAGDFDGDGNADLVIASLDEVATLRGRGDGTLAAPVLLPVARAMSSLMVADLTADGTDDVIGTNDQTDELLVFGSRGDGTLELESASPVGDRPMGAAIGDFDGDGVRDAAVINFGSDDVSILLGAGGRFMPEVRYPVRDQPHSIAAADLDLDGAIDLMVADNAGSPPTVGAGVTVMMGDGEGGFGPGIRVSSPVFPTRLASTDLDLDGLPDLVLLHQSTNDLSALLGVGDGTFLPVERTRAGLEPSWLHIADVNGDGRPDLVTANVGTVRPGISVVLHR